jgi:hypothetical protein
MKTSIITQVLLVVLAALPVSLFSQIIYTFDKGGNGFYNGSTYTNLVPFPASASYSTFEVTNAASLEVTLTDANKTSLFRGLSRTANVGSVDLTAIPSGADQQVEWTQYLKTSTTDLTKNGMVLRAQASAPGYASSVRQGYYFLIQTTGTPGLMKFRALRLDEAERVTNIFDRQIPITGYTAGPLYLRAIVKGTSLSFYYSLDNATWNLAATGDDATFAEGKVQIAWGLGGGSNVTDSYFDNVRFSVPK